MKEEHLPAIHKALNDLYSVVQSRDEVNLATIKLLHQRLSMVEIEVGRLSPQFEAGRQETAQQFKDRIAMIETQHERIAGALSRIKSLLDGSDEQNEVS